MIEHIKLPLDPAGYGDFSSYYTGTTLRIRFEYNNEGIERIGEIEFNFCIEYKISGILKNQTKMEYDIIFISDEIEYAGRKLRKYEFMLSGSDFQFFIISEKCSFSEVNLN